MASTPMMTMDEQVPIDRDPFPSLGLGQDWSRRHDKHHIGSRLLHSLAFISCTMINIRTSLGSSVVDTSIFVKMVRIYHSPLPALGATDGHDEKKAFRTLQAFTRTSADGHETGQDGQMKRQLNGYELLKISTSYGRQV